MILRSLVRVSQAASKTGSNVPRRVSAISRRLVQDSGFENSIDVTSGLQHVCAVTNVVKTAHRKHDMSL